jgi:Lamin Tail Domain/LGFP repeat
MPGSDVSIRRVIVNPPGPDVDAEEVLLHNGGDEDVDLTGWALTDALTHAGAPFSFTFPSFTLLSGLDVAVHTGSGTDDGQNLFWGRTEAAWNNKGDRVTLTDAGGSKVDSVTWPGPPQEGRVVDTSELEQDLAQAGTIDGVSPAGPVLWTTKGLTGGEMFWQEYPGDVGAAFHAGFPDSIPDGHAVPERPVIRVSGQIWKKYKTLGGPARLGRPLTRRQDIQTADGREARRQDFEDGSIVSSAESGAHWIRGAIRDKWLSPEAGGPSGSAHQR